MSDYQNFQSQVAEIEKAKKEWDEENEKIREEKERNGEPFLAETRSWPTLKERPFLQKTRKFVVSLDTLGQDRELTAEQRRFAIQTIADFAAIWEEREKENLTKDRNLRLKMTELDKEYTENLSAKLADDEEEHVKEHIHQITNPIVHQASSKEALGTEGSVHGEDHKEPDSHSEAPPINRHPYLGMDDEQRDMYQRALRLKYQAQGLKSDFFKQGFSAFAQSTVIKYPRVW